MCAAGQTEAVTAGKRVYTIHGLSAATWRRDNIEPCGNGQITLGAPHGSLDLPLKGGKVLALEFIEHRAGSFWDDEARAPYPHAVVEITDCGIETPSADPAYEPERSTPADLIDRIEIEGYRRVWRGAYVAEEDLDTERWISAADAQKRTGVADATIRQAINRHIEQHGARPTWAKKSAGTWLVRRDYAEKRWGKSRP